MERNNKNKNYPWVCTPHEGMPVFTILNENDHLLRCPIDPKGTTVFMNVGEVIDPSGKSQAARYVQHKYSPRSHALLTGPGRAIVSENTPLDFLAYQKALRGGQIDFITIENSQIPDPPEVGAPLKPYIPYMGLYEEAIKMGWEMPAWTEKSLAQLELLNNKLEIIRILRTPETNYNLYQLGLTERHTYTAPFPVETEGRELPDVARKRLDEIVDLYQRHSGKIKETYERNGIEYKPHKPKIIIRPTWGGGSYETFTVSQSTKDDGSPNYTIGYEGENYDFSDWQDVEYFINEKKENGNLESQYVITRFIETVEDPGINVFLFPDNSGGSYAYAAPVHGQVTNGTMCVGTRSWNPLPKEKESASYFHGESTGNKAAREKYHRDARLFAAFIGNQMAQNPPMGAAVIGVDVMIAGFFEKALSEAVRGTADEREAVDQFVIAEVNGRNTQRTMHTNTQMAIVKTVEGRRDEQSSVGEFIDFCEAMGRDFHFTSHDAMTVTQAGWKRLVDMANSPDTPGNILAGINGTASGAYIIMPPVEWKTDENGNKVSTMGIGVMGKSTEEVARLHEQFENLANGVEHEVIRSVDTL